MPVRKRRQAIVDRLLTLVDELNPFLDQFGAAYCRMPNAERAKRMVIPLQSQIVRDLLSYRFRARHHSRPNWKQIRQAVAEVRGKLLETWDGTSVPTESPTLRVLLKAAELLESWMGSAGELRDLLTRLDHQFDLGAGEGLPPNEDAMGIWLRDNYAAICANGIKIWRPKRCREKRRWAWRKVTIDADTGDTSSGNVSPEVSLRNQNAENEQRPVDTCDTLTEEEKMLQHLINTGGNP